MQTQINTCLEPNEDTGFLVRKEDIEASFKALRKYPDLSQYLDLLNEANLIKGDYETSPKGLLAKAGGYAAFVIRVRNLPNIMGTINTIIQKS